MRSSTRLSRNVVLAIGLAPLLCASAPARDATIQSVIHATFPNSVIEEHKVGISAATRETLGEAARVHLAPRWRWTYLTVTDPTRGVVAVAGEWKAVGRHGRIETLVLADPTLHVISVTVLKHREQHGKGIVHASFLDQFRGKTATDFWRVGKDVDGISGATVSSRAVASGTRHCLVYLKQFALPRPTLPETE
ncbi:MAG: FMN-binding protein [Verrucomicrobia bacterium]|jgi:Na+-translocating ferredoxin:NAD+ oxidoreductase subunit G|nr:FMN-binding protein [Verrucomicrobiota bacterium]MBT7067768.1 FMN-binding protein [Verrucomicrobiota bacterium]MBT7699197.1 FMN-binding protein [Verrucomicrobiota bacterium]